MADFRAGAKRVYDGSQYDPQQPPLGELAPVSLQDFLHAASLASALVWGWGLQGARRGSRVLSSRGWCAAGVGASCAGSCLHP